MLWTLLLEITLALLLAGAGWLLFLWAVRSGQYDDPEGPKYRMLEDDPPPGDGRQGREGEEPRN